MIGWAFAALSLAVAGYHAYKLVVTPHGRAERVAHLLMGLGMAAMFAPGAPTPPRPLAVIGYLAAVAVVLGGRPRHPHAVTGCLAMAYVFAVPSMHMAGMAMGPPGTLAWLNLALATYFIAEAAWTGRSMLTGPGADRADTACHMAVGVAMSTMLLAIG